MILGRSEIRRLIDAGLMENYSEDCLGGAGYDLRLSRVYRLKSASYLGKTRRETPQVQEEAGDTFQIAPGEYVLVETMEKVNMPGNVAARVLNRSTIFRCGCSLFNALVDPGYRGTLTFGLKNISDQKFTIERGAKISQIVFEEVAGQTVAYSGKYQGGKVV